MNIPQQRCTKAQEEMQRQGVDLLLVSPSSDLVYLISHHGFASERLTLFMLPASGQPAMLAPELEAPLARPLATFFAVHTWPDGGDPYAAVRSLVPGEAKTIAVSDQLWSLHLLLLQAALPEATFVPASRVLAPLRRIKDGAELDALHRAGAAADAAMADVLKSPLVGRNERETAQLIAERLTARGHQRVGFIIAASGPNSGSPHHVTGGRLLEEGDALVFDFGGVIDDYCSDITRSAFLGKPPAEYRRIYETVQEAQEKAFQCVRPGVPCQEADRVARAVISGAGYGDYFLHRTGHGLGLDGHEEPYMVEGNTMPMQPGMVFSIEPGIYIPGRFGVRIEDIVVVTDSGADRLNNAPRALQEL